MLVSTALSSSTRRLPASLPLLTTAATFSPSMHWLRAVLLLTTTAALAPAPKPLITPCAWQRDHCAREHALVREWYDKGRDQSRYGVGNWGVSYRQYVDGFVAAVADERGRRASLIAGVAGTPSRACRLCGETTRRLFRRAPHGTRVARAVLRRVIVSNTAG